MHHTCSICGNRVNVRSKTCTRCGFPSHSRLGVMVGTLIGLALWLFLQNAPNQTQAMGSSKSSRSTRLEKLIVPNTPK